MRAFLNKQIAGPLSRFVVDAHVGDGVEPESCRGLNGGEFRQFQAPEEILLDVADPRFDAPLLVGAADIAGRNLEAIMTGKIDIPRIEDRCGADQTLQDCRFEIIDLMCRTSLCGQTPSHPAFFDVVSTPAAT